MTVLGGGSEWTGWIGRHRLREEAATGDARRGRSVTRATLAISRATQPGEKLPVLSVTVCQ